MSDETLSDHKPGDDSVSPTPRIVVAIPTYNEIENLPLIIGRLHAAVPNVDVLVIDDGSPDGTGDLADQLAAADPRVHVLHRTEKAGLGAAYLAGFAWAIDAGYEVVVEMDADGSHQPEQLPLLLEQVKTSANPDGADLVLGSRWVDGGSVRNWPKHREVLSRGGNFYVRTILGVPLHDATGGFRAFHVDTLRALGLDQVASQGYCFQVDLAWRAVQRGLVVREVPIEFVERELGESKMDQRIVAEALGRVTIWGVSHRAQQVRHALRGRPKDHGGW
jgi:dolichol-phosphate mannosyltransferase